jgi:hypothetical protein
LLQGSSRRLRLLLLLLLLLQLLIWLRSRSMLLLESILLLLLLLLLLLHDCVLLLCTWLLLHVVTRTTGFLRLHVATERLLLLHQGRLLLLLLQHVLMPHALLLLLLHAKQGAGVWRLQAVAAQQFVLDRLQPLELVQQLLLLRDNGAELVVQRPVDAALCVYRHADTSHKQESVGEVLCRAEQSSVICGHACAAGPAGYGSQGACSPSAAATCWTAPGTSQCPAQQHLRKVAISSITFSLHQHCCWGPATVMTKNTVLRCSSVHRR